MNFLAKYANLFPGLSTSPRIIYVLLVLAAAIFASMIFLKIFERITSRKNLQELHHRINSWWWIWSLTTFAMLGGRVGTVMLFMGVSALALYEFFKILEISNKNIFEVRLAFLAVPLQYWFVLQKEYELFTIFVPVFMNFILAFALIATQKIQNFVITLGIMQWGLILTVFSFSHLAYFLNLDNPLTQEIEPLGLLTYFVIISQFNDVAQYIVGKNLGRVKILPKVSPNKTVEGLLGGVLATTVLSYFLGSYLTHMSLRGCLLAGVFISVTGFIGDTLMSAIKRDRQIKDFGSFLPGHGGILDRIDAVIISAPLFFHFYFTSYPEFFA